MDVEDVSEDDGDEEDPKCSTIKLSCEEKRRFGANGHVR